MKIAPLLRAIARFNEGAIRDAAAEGPDAVDSPLSLRAKRGNLDPSPGHSPFTPHPPLSYLDFLKLEMYARLVMTDSGGIQEETTVLNVPCLTLRENTERPITITHGTNVLVGTDPERIVEEAFRVLSRESESRVDVLNKHSKLNELPAPALWDGHSAQRIVDVLAGKRPRERPQTQEQMTRNGRQG